MRTMYDAVTPANIPANADLVAGYIDGIYRWADADWQRFPNIPHVRIAVHASTNDGHCLDVERGDAAPYEAPSWCVQARARGVDPTVYCSVAMWPEVVGQFRLMGVDLPHFWLAAYPGTPGLYAGAVAHQYRDAGPYDLSLVADYWPGVDPAPAEPVGGDMDSRSFEITTAVPSGSHEIVELQANDNVQLTIMQHAAPWRTVPLQDASGGGQLSSISYAGYDLNQLRVRGLNKAGQRYALTATAPDYADVVWTRAGA